MKHITKSINQFVIIYPTEKGWEQIEKNLLTKYKDENYKFILEERIKKFEEQKTPDGGYTDQLWNIISEHENLFFHGSVHLENTDIVFVE